LAQLQGLTGYADFLPGDQHVDNRTVGRVLPFPTSRRRAAWMPPRAETGWLQTLVVGDEPTIRGFLCEYLEERAGCRCTGVDSAVRALDALRTSAIDVALVALETSASNGLRLARQLREAEPDVPIVLLTGACGFETAVEAFRIGLFDCLLQPIDPTAFVDAVERAGVWRREALAARSRPEDLMRQVDERAAWLCETFSLHAGPSGRELQRALAQLNAHQPAALARARRVSRLSVAVASMLGIDEPAQHAIEQGALLQDLGKAAIPDAVVLKPGPLTEGEMAIMRRDPQIGYDIAVTVPALRQAAEIILATHERYDGTGYPRGLLGDAIPIGARIIAAVGAFDALTSVRLYRPRVSIERASEELARGAGSQFDPAVVAAWLRFVDQWPRTPGQSAEAAGLRPRRAREAAGDGKRRRTMRSWRTNGAADAERRKTPCS
jgi:putative two-component system response regulator